MSASVASAPAVAGGGPPDPNRNRPNKRSLPIDAPDTPTKRRVSDKLPCCRCLRRLRPGRGSRAGRDVGCVRPATSRRCQHCIDGKRGGTKGCVPVPLHLVSAARRLLRLNDSLVAGGDDAASLEEVHDEAELLHSRMLNAEKDVASRLPGASRSGGRRVSGGGSASPSAGAGESLAVLLGNLVEAVRFGVAAYCAVNNVETPRWAEEQSSSEGDEDDSE